MSDIQNDRVPTGQMANSNPEVEETVAQTDPMAEQNDIDEMASSAGVEIAPEEPLNMKNKLEERDKKR